MDLAFRTTACRVLVTSVLALLVQAGHAGLIGADQAPGQAPSPERVLVRGTLDRAEVIAQLQADGVDARAARERVQAMSEQEVQAMAHDIQASPAGGMSNAGWVALLLIAALVGYYATRKEGGDAGLAACPAPPRTAPLPSSRRAAVRGRDAGS